MSVNLPSMETAFLFSSKPPLSLFRLFAVVAVNVGVEVSWASLYSFALPILESIGVSESFAGTAYVSAALFAIFLLPLLGRISDNCTISFGKRRPFLLFFSLTVSLSSLFLPVIPDLVHLSHTFRVVLAFLFIAIMDVSFKFIESIAHAIVIDVCPKQQQVSGNFAFSLSVGFGSILGYLVAGLSLSNLLQSNLKFLIKFFPFLGFYSEMKLQFGFSLIVYFIFLLITIIFTKEVAEIKSHKSAPSLFKSISKTLGNLNPFFKNLLIIQIFSWISIFAVFQFTTHFFGIVVFNGNPHGSDFDVDLYNEGVRFGSFSLSLGSFHCIIFSLISSKLLNQSKNISIRKLKFIYSLGHLLAFSGLILSPFLKFSPKICLISMSFLGFQSAVAFSLPFSLIEKMAKPSELGTYASICCMCMAIGQVICSTLISLLITLIGSSSIAILTAALSSFIASLLINRLPMRLND
ncbi:hypothetical protein RCL1_005651 [Eukaryota sp. TZLM3-RCL]